MLIPLHLEATASTPRVHLDAYSGHFLIDGRAMPIDPANYFEPIINWLKTYAEDAQPRTTLSIRIDYFNSGASLMLTRMLQKMDAIPGAEIYWHYQTDDETIYDAGQDFSRFLRVPFHFIPEQEA